MDLMSPAQINAAYYIIRHYFGDTVASVLKALLHHDQISLRGLRRTLPKLKFPAIKRSILILIKYQLVDYVRSSIIEYSAVPERVLSLFRLPTIIQRHDKDEILITLMKSALLSKEKLIKTLSKDKTPEAETLISQSLENLISSNYIKHTSNNLCLNIEKLNRNHRDELIVQAIYNYYSRESRIKALARVVINLSFDNTASNASTTAPVPVADMITSLIPGDFPDKTTLDKYVAKLTSESNRFFMGNGCHPVKGLMITLNVRLVIDYLMKEHISSLISTRFGPRCCRIFRVLLSRGPLLLSQIEEFIMLPARDVREYSYMLIKQGLVRNRQVPKTPDVAPSKSVFIMSVDFDEVIFNISDLSCRTISNILIRYNKELVNHKALLDKSVAVQRLLESGSYDSVKANQEEWAEYFSSHELIELNRVNRLLDKLLKARLQVEETLFLTHKWLEMRPDS